jgi:hypothetical protein
MYGKISENERKIMTKLSEREREFGNMDNMCGKKNVHGMVNEQKKDNRTLRA